MQIHPHTYLWFAEIYSHNIFFLLTGLSYDSVQSLCFNGKVDTLRLKELAEADFCDRSTALDKKSHNVGYQRDCGNRDIHLNQSLFFKERENPAETEQGKCADL